MTTATETVPCELCGFLIIGYAPVTPCCLAHPFDAWVKIHWRNWTKSFAEAKRDQAVNNSGSYEDG
jgi:hypothetical protein